MAHRRTMASDRSLARADQDGLETFVWWLLCLQGFIFCSDSDAVAWG